MPSTSSSDILTPIRLKRSSTAKKRPNPANLLVGQPALNTNAAEPGLYFADSTKSSLIKIGPCHVGVNPPNLAPLPTGGYAGNSLGEFWLDTTETSNPILKVWNGTNWIPYGHIESNVIWVDSSGDDSNDGRSPVTPKKTIKAAVEDAIVGTQIRVSPGNYSEDNPIVFPYANVSLIGSDPSTCVIELENDANLFEIRSGCRVENLSFTGNPVTSRNMVSFVSTGAGTISQEPSVKNCINLVEGSVGVLSNGSLTTGKAEIIVNSLRQKGENIVGLKASNLGFVLATNCETVYAEKTAFAESGGSITLSGCKSSLGIRGLHSDGKGSEEQSGVLTSTDSSGSVLTVGSLAEPLRPYVGQILSVGTLYYKVGSFLITNPGLGYSSAPSVSVGIGSGPNAVRAVGKAIIKDGLLIDIEVLLPGSGISQLESISVTLSGGSPTVPATASIVKEPIFYTVLEASEIDSNSSTVTLAENIPYTPAPGSLVRFYRASRISSVSHLMEYVGCGATSPYEGGVPVAKNEVVATAGGKAFVSSLNQSGTFSVGTGFQVDINTGTVFGDGFDRSVLNLARLQSLSH
jgi:hypothetical protein